MTESVQEEHAGLGVFLGAFADFSNSAKKHLSHIANNTEARGIFKAFPKALLSIPAAGNATVDFGSPAKGRMWMVRQLIAFEANQEFNAPTSSQVSSTGAAGASVTATLGFFTPTLTGFDVSIQPATAAGVATVTVTGAGKTTLTYYIEESTSNTETLSIRYPGLGLVGYSAVTVSAVASGGIATVNVFGVSTGSPAQIGWYVGAPDTSIGTANAKPPTAGLRWVQGLGSESTDVLMPFIDNFGNRVFPVTAPDHLVAYLTGGIGGENFTLTAVVEEYRIRDMESMRA